MFIRLSRSLYFYPFYPFDGKPFPISYSQIKRGKITLLHLKTLIYLFLSSSLKYRFVTQFHHKIQNTSLNYFHYPKNTTHAQTSKLLIAVSTSRPISSLWLGLQYNSPKSISICSVSTSLNHINLCTTICYCYDDKKPFPIPILTYIYFIIHSHPSHTIVLQLLSIRTNSNQ